MQNKFSEIKFFDEWAEKCGYYEVHPRQEYQRILRESGILKENRHQLVLDAGCGSGAFSVALSEIGFKVIGVDISSKLISAAHNRAKNSGLNISYVIADIEKLPLKFGSINSIFCGAILHHLPTRIEYVANEFNRILAIHGKIFICEPNALNLSNFIIYNFSSKTSRTEGEKALHPRKLKQQLERNGFCMSKYRDIGNVLTVGHGNKFEDTSKLSFIQCFSRKTFAFLVNSLNKIPFIPGIFFVASFVKEKPKTSVNYDTVTELLPSFLHPQKWSPLIEKKLDFFRSNLKGEKVLDVGCGSGYVSRAIREDGFDVVSIDVDEACVMQSKFASNRLGIEYPIIMASVTNLPIKDGSFDTVICSEVLEHLPQLNKALAEVNRVLKRGGRLCISTPGRLYLVDKLIDNLGLRSRHTSLVLKKEAELGLVTPSKGAVKRTFGHIHSFTPSSISKLLEEANFKIIIFENHFFASQFSSAFFLGLLGKKRSYIRNFELIDLKISGYMPLILGGGWLIVCEK